MMEWENKIMDKGGRNYHGMYFQFWSNKLNSAVFSVAGTTNIVFDVNQGKVIREFSGEVIGTNREGTLVAVHPSGKDRFSKVEIVNLMELK